MSFLSGLSQKAKSTVGGLQKAYSDYQAKQKTRAEAKIARAKTRAEAERARVELQIKTAEAQRDLANAMLRLARIRQETQRAQSRTGSSSFARRLGHGLAAFGRNLSSEEPRGGRGKRHGGRRRRKPSQVIESGLRKVTRRRR